MSKKFERVFRTGNLTPEEVACDEVVRHQVQAEFPPAKPKATVDSSSLSAALRQAIQASGLSISEIARNAGVSEVVVSQFLSGERDIHLVTADKLADVLGMKLSAES